MLEHTGRGRREWEDAFDGEEDEMGAEELGDYMRVRRRGCLRGRFWRDRDELGWGGGCTFKGLGGRRDGMGVRGVDWN